MKKQIMKRAWEIARTAVKRFGGKASEYIAEALRMAWAQYKACGTTVAAKKGDIKVVRAWVSHFFPNLSGLLESQLQKGDAAVTIYMDHAEMTIGNIDVEFKTNSNNETTIDLWYCGTPFAEVA